MRRAELPKGFCALPVRVYYRRRVPAFYPAPGERVDVYTETRAETGTTTDLHLKDVLVLANGGGGDIEGGERGEMVILLVTEEQAEGLRSAHNSVLRLTEHR
jgi:Flp pilus assembly protein CpaB